MAKKILFRYCCLLKLVADDAGRTSDDFQNATFANLLCIDSSIFTCQQAVFTQFQIDSSSGGVADLIEIDGFCEKTMREQQKKR